MSAEWKRVKVDDIKSQDKYSCVGGPFGSSLSRKHYVEDIGVPVIRGVNLSNDIFWDDDFVFVSEEKGQELYRNLAFPGDLVFTQRGTLGQVALIPEHSKFPNYVVSQSQMKLTVNKDVAHPYYVYLYFRSKDAKEHIERNAIVGGVPHINLGILKALELPLPPLSEQHEIVRIVSSIDDKITLNTQTNQTLEQMAQALFKSWFVDFDPVIDNALDSGFFEREFAGEDIPEPLAQRVAIRQALREATAADTDASAIGRLPPETRALFPDRFEKHPELGWIPKGWEAGCLADVASYTSNRIATAELSLSNYVSTENMLVEKKGITEAAGLPTVSTVPAYTTGNVLISNIRPYFKKIWMASGDGGHSNDVLGFVAKDTNTEGYLFNLLYQDALFDFMMTTSKGSKMPRGDKKAIMGWPIIIPPCDLRKYFSEQVGDFYVLSSERVEENKALSQLRDTLLPKLLSGEMPLDSFEIRMETTA